MSLEALNHANKRRQEEWPGNDKADIAFRALEVAGEFGEVAEAVKKYLRAERGIAGSTATKDDVAREMGDAIISLDLLAQELGIPLYAAVPWKFNQTSRKYGLQTMMPTASDLDTIERNADLTLWCVHVLGADDVLATETHADAVQEAKALNMAVLCRADAPVDVMCFAYAAPWPGTPDSHADDLKARQKGGAA